MCRHVWAEPEQLLLCCWTCPRNHGDKLSDGPAARHRPNQNIKAVVLTQSRVQRAALRRQLAALRWHDSG